MEISSIFVVRVTYIKSWAKKAKYILYKILGKPAMVVIEEIHNDLSCPHVGDTHT